MHVGLYTYTHIYFLWWMYVNVVRHSTKLNNNHPSECKPNSYNRPNPNYCRPMLCNDSSVDVNSPPNSPLLIFFAVEFMVVHNTYKSHLPSFQTSKDSFPPSLFFSLWKNLIPYETHSLYLSQSWTLLFVCSRFFPSTFVMSLSELWIAFIHKYEIACSE